NRMINLDKSNILSYVFFLKVDCLLSLVENIICFNIPIDYEILLNSILENCSEEKRIDILQNLNDYFYDCFDSKDYRSMKFILRNVTNKESYETFDIRGLSCKNDEFVEVLEIMIENNYFDPIQYDPIASDFENFIKNCAKHGRYKL